MPKTLFSTIASWTVLPLLIISLLTAWYASTLKTGLATKETDLTKLKATVEAKSLEITTLTQSVALEKFNAQQLRNERESISAIHIQHQKEVKALRSQLSNALADNQKLREHTDEAVKNWVNCPVPAAVTSLYKYARPGSENGSGNRKCLPAATGRAN